MQTSITINKTIIIIIIMSMIMDPTTIRVIRIMVTITTKTNQEITSSHNRIVNKNLIIITTTTATTMFNRKRTIVLRKTTVTATLTPDSNSLNSILPLMLRDNKRGIRNLRIISLIILSASTSKGNPNKIPKMSSTSLETTRYHQDRLSAL